MPADGKTLFLFRHTAKYAYYLDETMKRLTVIFDLKYQGTKLQINCGTLWTLARVVQEAGRSMFRMEEDTEVSVVVRT
jgi:hypothetical protein